MDEIFFVDLPDASVRQEIFKIHLDKRSLSNIDVDLEKLAKKSEGFSGSEIEQVIIGALYSALADEAAVSQMHLEQEITQTRPLSVVMAEKISELRSWAESRTVSAH
jgi:SpoVK/Ycf46/Vps4 family AAA+-type ATPase